MDSTQQLGVVSARITAGFGYGMRIPLTLDWITRPRQTPKPVCRGVNQVLIGWGTPGVWPGDSHNPMKYVFKNALFHADIFVATRASEEFSLGELKLDNEEIVLENLSVATDSPPPIAALLGKSVH